MKYVVLFLAIGVSLCQAYSSEESDEIEELMLHDVASTRAMEGMIMQKIEELRALMKNGNPDMNIPVLDPFIFKNTVLNIKLINGTWFNLTLDGGQMVGLSSFNITNLKLNLLPVTFTMNMYIPIIAGEGTYDITGLAAGLIPLYGAGPFKSDVRGITFGLVVSVGTKNTILYLKDISLVYKLECMTLGFEGLLGGDLGEVMQDMVGQMAPELLYRFYLQYNPQVEDIVGGLVDKYILANRTLNDIIWFITSTKAPATSTTPITLIN